MCICSAHFQIQGNLSACWTQGRLLRTYASKCQGGVLSAWPFGLEQRLKLCVSQECVSQFNLTQVAKKKKLKKKNQNSLEIHQQLQKGLIRLSSSNYCILEKRHFTHPAVSLQLIREHFWWCIITWPSVWRVHFTVFNCSYCDSCFVIFPMLNFRWLPHS